MGRRLCGGRWSLAVMAVRSWSWRGEGSQPTMTKGVPAHSWRAGTCFAARAAVLIKLAMWLAGGLLPAGFWPPVWNQGRARLFQL
ncbi:hypothetical protein RHECNPAF_4310088 [Rhizobium etli CNPAF512]|nr:hypothetical protein RHECNPAF_4310088 [Rhizobium etli CNPAF512]